MNVQDLLGLDTKQEVDMLITEIEHRFGPLPPDPKLFAMEAYLHVTAAVALVCGMERYVGNAPVPPVVIATMQAMGNLAKLLRRPPGPPAKLITVVQS